MTPSEQGERKYRQDLLRRFNILLRFATVDPWKLNNGALEKLLDEMFFAIMGNLSAQEKQVFRSIFDSSANREALSEAQRVLERAIQHLLIKPKMGLSAPFTFDVAKQRLMIFSKKDGFDYRFGTDHFPSEVYIAFTDTLKTSGVNPTDILTCSHCGTLFVPLRKPPKGKPVYCSHKCAAVIASRNYRARRAKKKRTRQVL